jgi:hypothetical protein
MLIGHIQLRIVVAEQSEPVTSLACVTGDHLLVLPKIRNSSTVSWFCVLSLIIDEKLSISMILNKYH